MSQAAYKYIAEAWKKPNKSFQSANWQRLIDWRAGESFVRVEKPLRVDRARSLGYKAKPGFVIVRARVRRGGLRKQRFDGGRVPSKMGVLKITQKKNLQWIAEERTSKRYPNLQVLNSYWVGEDGGHKYFEVILVDAHHPAIINDNHYNFLAYPSNAKRVLRGKTSAGQKGRGLLHKGTGAEHLRPSVRKGKQRKKLDRRTRVVRKNFKYGGA